MAVTDPATVSLMIVGVTYDLEDLREQGATHSLVLDPDSGGAGDPVGDVDANGFGDFLVGGLLDVMVVFSDGVPLPSAAAILDGSAGARITGGIDHGGAGSFDGIAGAEILVRSGGQVWVITNPTAGQTIDATATTGDFGVRIVSDATGSGFTVGAAGDLNGDGLADALLADRLVNLGNGGEGIVYVVFGRETTEDILLSEVAAGIGGSAISAAPDNAMFGNYASAAGDVNADGFDDLILYARQPGTDQAWVVFGEASPASLTIDNLGDRGFEINPGSGVDAWEARGIGDFDGDGLDDVAISDPKFVLDAREETEGRVFIIWGKDDAEPVDLSSFPGDPAGTVIDGASAPGLGKSGDFGYRVLSLGDQDGDGRGDLALAARTAYRSNPVEASVGRMYVVPGRPRTESVDLAALSRGDGGFVLMRGRYDKVIGLGMHCIARPGGCDLFTTSVNDQDERVIELIPLTGLL